MKFEMLEIKCGQFRVQDAKNSVQFELCTAGCSVQSIHYTLHTAHYTVQNEGCSVKSDTGARASVTVHITQEVFCHLTPLVASLIPPASP